MQREVTMFARDIIGCYVAANSFARYDVSVSLLKLSFFILPCCIYTCLLLFEQAILERVRGRHLWL